MSTPTNEPEYEHVSIPRINLPGPDHRAEKVNVLTPGKAFWRTILQVGPVTFAMLLGVIPPVIDTVLDGFGSHLPPEVYAYLAGASVVVTALAATLARVMALTKVQELFKKLSPFFAAKEVTAKVE